MPVQQYQAYPQKAPQIEMHSIEATFEGAATSITEREGVCISATWVSTGRYTLSIPRYFKALVSWQFSFGANTPAGVKGYTASLDRDSMSLGNPTTVDVFVYDSAFNLVDLAAAQFISISLKFRDTGIKTT